MSRSKSLFAAIFLFCVLFIYIEHLHHPLAADAILDTSNPAYVDEEHVIVQACLPDKIVAFENVELDLRGKPPARSFITTRTGNGLRGQPPDNHNVILTSPDQGDKAIVRKWVVGSGPKDISDKSLSTISIEDANHAPSESGIDLPLFGNTTKNQPIYESEWTVRQGDAIALAINVSANTSNKYDEIHYWFELPKTIPRENFTDWQEPLSQENYNYTTDTDKTDIKLLNRKQIHIYPVGQNAPRMRFRIMSVRDYFDSYQFWHREQEAITWKYFVNITDEVRSKLHFAPLRSDIIPDCDIAIKN